VVPLDCSARTVGFVVAIACANVANLLLALRHRGRRESPFAAQWEPPLAFIRQLLIESVLLSLVGAIWIVARDLGDQSIVATGPTNILRLQQVAVDSRVLLFTFLISTVVGIVFGLIPALHASRPDLNDSSRRLVGAAVKAAPQPRAQLTCDNKVHFRWCS